MSRSLSLLKMEREALSSAESVPRQAWPLPATAIYLLRILTVAKSIKSHPTGGRQRLRAGLVYRQVSPLIAQTISLRRTPTAVLSSSLRPMEPGPLSLRGSVALTDWPFD